MSLLRGGDDLGSDIMDENKGDFLPLERIAWFGWNEELCPLRPEVPECDTQVVRPEANVMDSAPSHRKRMDRRSGAGRFDKLDGCGTCLNEEGNPDTLPLVYDSPCRLDVTERLFPAGDSFIQGRNHDGDMVNDQVPSLAGNSRFCRGPRERQK